MDARLPGARGGVRTVWDNVALVAQLRCPLMVIHGLQDSVVPVTKGARAAQTRARER